MKKYMLVSLVIAFLLVTVGGPCLAGTVANTSKKGSLVIIPLIRTDETVPGETWETLITLGNDNFYSVGMQCVFVLKDEGCDHLSYQPSFQLTANQPVTFRASDGYTLDGNDILGGGIGIGHVAEAKCWVTHFVFDDEGTDNSTAISYNHITAEVTLLRQYGGQGLGAATYSAWRFAANAPMGSPVGTPGILPLTGDANNYDSCPAALVFDYFKQEPTPLAGTYTGVDNYVALTPCKQDFTQDGGPGQVKFDVKRWDENEKNANGHICLDCFVATSLDDIPFPGLNTSAGAFKVTPYVPTTCPTTGETTECKLKAGYVAYPAVGVIVKRFEGFSGPMTAVTPTGVGEWVGNAAVCKGTPAITFP